MPKIASNIIFFSGHYINARSVMAEPRLLQGQKGSVTVGQRLIPGHKGSVLAGGQIGTCSGRLHCSPNDCNVVTRDVYRSS